MNELGSRIDLSDEHPANANWPIPISSEFSSNVTLHREMQRQKQRRAIVFTQTGMQINLSDEHLQNASLPIRSNLEFGSNVTVSRERQDWKQREPMI
jgi:regulation of enolase protein 1 (concanavalin A-like superfamily)